MSISLLRAQCLKSLPHTCKKGECAWWDDQHADANGNMKAECWLAQILRAPATIKKAAKVAEG